MQDRLKKDKKKVLDTTSAHGYTIVLSLFS